MKPRITLITLGVDNLERSLAFYRRLGFESDGILGKDDPEGGVVFFKLENIRLALWERKSIARDTTLPLSPRSPTEFMLAHNVSSPKFVDDVIDEARQAGASILKPAAKTFWGGYAGCFQDPDGHIWEVAYNPAWEQEN
jgi:predicted lactoylglutathione lyase